MTTASATRIELLGLTKDFGALRAVDGLSLAVQGGEVVGLLGPNGAGKTTALRMLAGLLTPTSGRALVDGIDVAENALEARRKLGFLTTSTGLYDRLTPRELLTTFGKLHGMAQAALGARIDALVAQLEMKDFVDKRCAALSAGQRQRASIARAIVHDPVVYVLDEPTAALDPIAARAILDLVRTARSQGRAVLFSTHRMEEAEYLCDRLTFLRAGKAVAQGSARELLEKSGQTSLTGAFLHYASESPG